MGMRSKFVNPIESNHQTNPAPRDRHGLMLPSMVGVMLSGLGALAIAPASVALPPATDSLIAQATQPNSSYLIFVHPAVGNDGADGSQRSPLRTITHALTVAQPNTVILLAPGTYSAATGEVFPLQLKPGVSVQGEPTQRGQGVVIQGGGEFLSPTAARQNVAIVGSDQAMLIGVTVTNTNPRGYGLWIESSSPTVTNSTFRDNTHDGITVNGSSTAIIQDNIFFENGASGVAVFGTAQPQIRGNVFEQTGFGINVVERATPLIIGNRISRNRNGVVVQEHARPVLRENTIEGNEEAGVVAIAQSLPDLGTAAAPGNNLFRNNGQHDINATAAQQTIAAVGNQLNPQRLAGQVTTNGGGSLTAAPIPSVPFGASLPVSAATSTSANPAPRPIAVSASPTATTPRVTTPAIAPALPTRPVIATPIPVAPSPAVAIAPATTPQPTIPNRSGAFAALPHLPPAAIPVITPPAATPQPTIGITAPGVRRNPILEARMARQAPSAAATEAIAIPAPAPTTPTRNLDFIPRARANNASVIPPTASPQPEVIREVTTRRSGQTQPFTAFSAQSTPLAAGAIDIPVPAPETGFVPRTTSSPAPRAVSTAPSGSVLLVPGSNIPVGNVGNMPTVNIARYPQLQGVPRSSNRSAAARGLRYRVVVDAASEQTQAQVQSLIPGAFLTSVNGRQMVQVGAFSDRTNADEITQQLLQIGVQAIVQPIQ